MKPTIDDIAKKAGVSKATVSRVLNDKSEGVSEATRVRIKALIQELAFQPCAVARGLATGKSRSVGLIIPDIANPFYPPLVRGIESALFKRGYGLFLCDSDKDVGKEKEHIRSLLEKRVDGVILSSVISDCDCQLDLLEERGTPFVLLDRIIETRKGGAAVYLDNRRGAKIATDHLIRRGVSRLLFINGPEDLALSKLRLLGVQEAWNEGPGERKPIILRHGDYTATSGESIVVELLEGTGGKPHFNGIFAANDMMALGALRTLKKWKIRVPQDVGLVGFDDVEAAQYVDPPLTTIAQPTFEMGKKGAELLLRLMDGEKPRKRIVVMEPRLVIRGSTGDITYSIGG
jgi:LacI family transcriptional regulator